MAHPKRGFVKPDSLNSVTIAVIPLCCWAVLHAVVPIPYVLEKVNLHKPSPFQQQCCTCLSIELDEHAEATLQSSCQHAQARLLLDLNVPCSACLDVISL